MEKNIIYERVFLEPEIKIGTTVKESTANTVYKCRECDKQINKGDLYYYLILHSTDPKSSKKFLCSDCYKKHPGARLFRPKDSPGPNVLQIRAPNEEWINKE